MLAVGIVLAVIGYFWYQWKKEQEEIRKKKEYHDDVDRQINKLVREDAEEQTRRIKRYMNSTLWEFKRDKRLDMDNHTCLLCGSKEDLEVHHISYNNIGHESVLWLRTVCKNCHKDIHDELGYPSYDPWDYLQGFFWKEEWDNNK